MTRATRSCEHWMALAVITAACSGVDDDAPAFRSTSTAGSATTTHAANAPSDRYEPGSSSEDEVADPEAALAAIPNEMRPTQLLPALKRRLLVPNVGKHGAAMFTDVVTVEPGQDVTFCTYVPGVTDRTLYIHDTQGAQTSSGHHAILHYTTSPSAPGTRLCDPESPEAQQGQILGGTGGEGNGAIKVPGNVVSAVPAGSQFIINHHWINTTDEPMQAQAEMITVPPDNEDNLIIARALVVTSINFAIPANQTVEHSVTCMFDRDVTLLSMFGHQHSWGTHVEAERVGSQPEVIFDHDYDETMISHPLTKDFSVEAPYQLSAGEGVRMTCQWNNNTDAALSFPREMCVFFGWQIGASADSQCVDGTWFK